MTTLIINIKELLQIREKTTEVIKGSKMKYLPSLNNAYLLIVNDTIADFGLMNELNGIEADKTIDALDKMVLPAWCDSHTHIVFAGNRVQEFVDRIHGMSYEEIAKRGGGILNSAQLMRNTSEENLYNQSKARIEEVMRLGTGAIEIKSGYGLITESELKMLRVIKRIKSNYPLKVKSTFLAAHAIPKKYQTEKAAYLNLILNEMLPLVAKEELANYIDVFCEQGYFNLTETDKILKAGLEFKLIGKIHVNQFNAFGGVAVAVKNKALSVDHLEELNKEDIEVLQGTNTIPVALPTCSYFLGIPYTPARKIIDADLPLALASDYNPGSTPSGNMNFVISTACIKMKMTPEEAINAATLNGAYAMGVAKQYGSITRGKKANLIITKPIPSIYFLPYSFGSNNIDMVLINGQII